MLLINQKYHVFLTQLNMNELHGNFSKMVIMVHGFRHLNGSSVDTFPSNQYKSCRIVLCATSNNKDIYQ
jgi:hypothetical protein